MDFKILGSLNSLAVNKTAASGASAETGFAELVKGALDNTVQTQKTAETLTTALAQGENVPMHKVIQAVSEAEITLQTMVTVRDKALEAYQEILRMPI